MLRRRLDGFAVSINRPVSQLTVGGGLTQPAQHVFFCNSKGQHGFETKLAFLASHEARRRMAVFPIQLTTNPHQTREPRGPSPSGGKTPAKPHVLRVPPRPMGRGVGCRAARGRCKAGCPWDNPVCLWQTELFKFYLKSSPSPSGHNRRRRLATGSRQPKRGFGTAVPKTTIEVADHCPCLSGRWLRGRIRRTRGSSRCRRR